MKEHQLCKDFLRMRKGTELEAIMASQMLRDHWGIQVDWHKMNAALESLVRSQEAERTGRGPDGFTIYLIQ